MRHAGWWITKGALLVGLAWLLLHEPPSSAFGGHFPRWSGGRSRVVSDPPDDKVHASAGKGSTIQGKRTFPALASRLAVLLGDMVELRSPITDRDRRRVIGLMFHEGDRSRHFAWRFGTLMALSVCLATLGLIADSPAVIIGAMVVAPLMGPVLGVAASLVMGWPSRGIRQAVIVIVAAAGAVALATLISALLPGELDGPPRELLARTEPNALDLAVAMTAGAVGAYTLVRREAAEAMAGAAIAVALVPPLATIGIALESGRADMAFGATLLVVANVVGVVFSGAITFLFGGFVPGVTLSLGIGQILRGLRWVLLAVLLMVIPLQWSGPGILSPPPEASDVDAVVAEWAVAAPALVEVINVVVEVTDGTTNVAVVVASPTELPDINLLADQLSNELDRDVTVEVQRVLSATSRATGSGD